MKLTARFYALPFILALAGCTAQLDAQEGIKNSEFQLPVKYYDWKASKHDGVCTLKGANHGLTITYGAGEPTVKGSWIFEVGNSLTARTDRNVYRTFDRTFAPDTARALLADMRQGGRLYVEQIRPNTFNSRERFFSMADLNGFAAAEAQCAK